MPRIINRLSLRFILVVPFLIIIAVTTTLIGYLAFRNGQFAVNRLASQLQGETTLRIYNHLDSYLETPFLINNINLDNIQLGNLDINDRDAATDYFLAQIKRFESVISIAYATEQKEYLGTFRDVLGVQYGVGLSSKDTNYALEALAFDENNMVGEPIDSLPDYDPRKREWYIAPVEAEDPVWTPVYIWPYPTGTMSVEAALPVYDDDGGLSGVLDTSVSLNQIDDFLHTLDIFGSGHAFITTRSGKLIASSTDVLPYMVVNDEPIHLMAMESGDQFIQASVRQAINQFGDLESIIEAHNFYFKYNNERYYSQISVYKNRNLEWLTITALPESAFMEQIHKNNRNTVLMIIASVALSMLFTLLTARWIINPLLRLNRASKAIAEGNWQQHIPIDRDDEVGELTRTFNAMAIGLQQLFTSLQDSESRYKEIFESSPISLWEEDFSDIKQHIDELRASGIANWETYFHDNPQSVHKCMELVKVIDINESTLTLFDYTDKEQLIADFSMLLINNADTIFRDEIIALANGALCFEGETTLTLPDGQERPLLLSLSIPQAYKETWKKVLITIIDISQRKELEVAHQQRLELELELEKERELVNLKNRFISIVSHEFRTPLAVIQTSTDLLHRYADKITSERREELTQQITDQVMGLTSLIDETLILGRGDSGKIQFTPELLNFDAICNKIVEKIQLVDKEQHNLVFDNRAPNTIVLVDKKLIEHIFNNLLTNALKYSPPNTTITCQLHSTDEQIIFSVKDEGIGIPEDDIPKLFTAFHRASNVGRQQGNGLGLAIVKQYVELHDGTIGVESEEGKGSTFTVILPIKQAN